MSQGVEEGFKRGIICKLQMASLAVEYGYNTWPKFFLSLARKCCVYVQHTLLYTTYYVAVSARNSGRIPYSIILYGILTIILRLYSIILSILLYLYSESYSACTMPVALYCTGCTAQYYYASMYQSVLLIVVLQYILLVLLVQRPITHYNSGYCSE